MLISFSFATSCKAQGSPLTGKPVSHEAWTNLLRKYVSPDGKVNYPGFIRDKQAVQEYLDLLGANHPDEQRWTRAEATRSR